jgi:predicted nucleic acid-binding protein
MIGLDTTVLVAHELKEIHSREKVRAHISTLSRSKETRFALAPQVLQEFLHVVTDSRRFENPLSMEEALARARFWWTASETAHCHPSDHLGRKRILDTNLASTYHSHGIIKLATVNPADFAIFEVFEFETWAFTL